MADDRFASVFASPTPVRAEFRDGDEVSRCPVIAWAVRHITYDDGQGGDPGIYTEVVGLIIIEGLPTLIPVDDDECGAKFVQYVYA